MKVETKLDRDNSEAVVKIEVGAAELEPFLKEAAKKLSADKPIKGFRPGKVPVKTAMEVFGQERVLNEVVDRAVPQFFVKAVIDEEIEAIARPKVAIEKVDLQELVFTATVDILPEVKLGDIGSIKVEEKTIEVSDEEIDKELRYLAKMRADNIEVARPAKKDDTVTVDFRIIFNGEVIEGGESKNHPVQLGEGHFVPGFEEKLEGIQAGDTREFNFTFPADYGKKDWQGKEVQAQVKAHKVQKKVLPKIDDEFAKQLGKFKDLAELKDSLKKHTQFEKETKERERRQGELSAKLAETATFTKIPGGLIEKEIDRRIEEINQMLAMQKKTLDEYAAAQGKNLEEIRKGMKETAEKSVKVGLALRQFSAQENIEVTKEEVEEKANEYLKQYGASKDKKIEIDPEDLKERMTNLLKNQKTLSKLEEMTGSKMTTSQ